MAEPACDDCAGPSVVYQRYSGARLCARHLHGSVERRARKEFAQANLPGRGPRLLVAYSGGKDSTVALHVVHGMRETRPGLEIVALTVDEGIAGYRPQGIEVARKVCTELGIEHVVRRTKDVADASVDEAHAKGPGTAQCGFCGVFRRRIMNDVAKEVAADAVVTGHNLDDVSQSILMNLASANLDKMAKLAPHDTKPGFVPRILPLRTIPETEVYLYALTKGLRWHEAECPYAERAGRGVYRDVLYRLEEARPGTRHALLKTHEELRPLLAASRPPDPMKACPSCGEPTSGERCKACEFRAVVASS